MERVGKSKNKNTQVTMNCLLDIKKIFMEKNADFDEINQAIEDALLNTLYELSFLQNDPNYKVINIFEIITNHKKFAKNQFTPLSPTTLPASFID